MMCLFLGRPTTWDDDPFEPSTYCYMTPEPSPQTTNPVDERAAKPDLLRKSNRPHPRTIEGVDAWPVTTLLITKQAELGKIIKEVQLTMVSAQRMPTAGNDHWVEALYTKLNARLCNWHNLVPSEMRWSRWSSSFEELDPGLATLQ